MARKFESICGSGFSMDRAGYPFIFSVGFATLVFAILQMTIPAIVGLAAFFFVCSFFRDPERAVPRQKGVVVSPADGKVIFAGQVESDPYQKKPAFKISIFMTIFNVHVNRIPVDGKIRRIIYSPGGFLPADRKKASLRNERNALVIEMPDGRTVTAVQVAGLVARRIVCRVQEEEIVQRGQRYGIICFGSRLDLYLPVDFEIAVKKGKRVFAGSSILGNLS